MQKSHSADGCVALDSQSGRTQQRQLARVAISTAMQNRHFTHDFRIAQCVKLVEGKHHINNSNSLDLSFSAFRLPLCKS